MLIATISFSRSGYQLQVATAPLWALVAEEIAQALCARLGHPLCSGIGPFAWGWSIGQRLLSPASRRLQYRWSAPLTTDDVRATFPESVIDLDD